MRTTLIKKIKDAGQDFEFFPTTDEIIEVCAAELNKINHERMHIGRSTMIDVCFGDGKTIQAISDRSDNCFDLCGFEKSGILRNSAGDKIEILGTDFMQSSILMSMRSVVIFCNPPFSEYAEWVEKIISEAPHDSVLLLVIPRRWRDAEIARVIQDKAHEMRSLGIFDFSKADRAARATVEVLALELYANQRPMGVFERFLEDTFADDDTHAVDIQFTEEENADLARHTNIVESLTHSYGVESRILRDAIEYIRKIPKNLREALGLDNAAVAATVKAKAEDLRLTYWKRLFDETREISKRMTCVSRSKMRATMEAKKKLDFTRDNAYAILGHVIDTANEYIDEQIICMFESFLEYANVDNYKSNHKVITQRGFAYGDRSELKDVKIKLGHRLVLERRGGMENYFGDRKNASVSGQAANFIADILTVANTLGMEVLECELPENYRSHESSYRFDCRFNGKVVELLHVKLFLNRNMHVKLHPRFVGMLNARHGVLKGWLRNDPVEISHELDVSIEDAIAFAAHDQKLNKSILKLC